MTISIPNNFSQTMIELYGDKGAAWLQTLPTLITNCEERWSLTAQPPFPNLSYNYVAPAVRSDGTAVVLKIGIVNPELLSEIDALHHFDGQGIVHLLDADPTQGVLLLERLQPGTPLDTLDDDEAATTIAARVMARLWVPTPPNHAFPTVGQWADGLSRLRPEFNGGFGPFPRKLVETAESLFNELLPTQADPVLLHGDLHHWNILQAQRAPWLALDPKGVVGEPAYEIGAWLRNPVTRLMDWPDLRRIQARRVDQFSEMLSFDRDRIIGWGIAQAVLSAWWSYEDHGRIGQVAIACAESLVEI